MSFKKHYLTWVGGGIVIIGLAIAVIVLAVEVARLSNELNDNGNTDEPWKTNYRLPEQLVPHYYVINMHPNMETGTFSGYMSLDFEVAGDSLNYLPIHQKGLKISDLNIASLMNNKMNERVVRSVGINSYIEVPENEFSVIFPSEILLPGNYTVSMKFSGSLNQPELVGIYSSEYSVSSDTGFEERRKLVTSKFEPTYARRAFPCLDEPDKKAFYKISLVKPKDQSWTALSNMDVATIEPGPGDNEETVNFNYSVKMSSYLAVFIVSEFKHETDTANTNGKSFPVSVFGREFPSTTPSKLTYPLSVAKHVVEYYINYFGIDYPLPKLDLIGIPDFVSGAMENWGLITFRETNLLVTEGVDAIANIQQVGSVISHEIAHMWFGNLVTMKWWDDLWLNEGFASFMEYKALDNFKPEYKMLDQFLVSDLQPVLALDAQLSSHPIIQPVAHPDQITEIFDTITYSKGCSVIRMLEGILGKEVFQQGVSDYLRAFNFGNAVTQDLWKSLTAAASNAGNNADVATIMDTWTLQMGFPVIDVKYDQTTKIATVSQSRFFGSPNARKLASAAKDSPFGYSWEVPLTFIYFDGATPSGAAWLKKGVQSVTINMTSPSFKFNSQQIGFYRVNYEEQQWKSLLEGLKTRALKEATDRSSIVDDVFSLADGQYVKYELALNISLYLIDNEDDYVPWSTAASKLLKLLPFLRGQNAGLNFKKYVGELVDKQYKKLSWTAAENEEHLTKRLRSTILNLACSCDNEDCLNGAAGPFSDWIQDITKNGDVNVRQLMYNFGIQRLGNVGSNWETVWSRYLNEKDPQEKLKLMIALTYVQSNTWLNIYLERAKNESYVRSQDYFSVLQYMSDNPVGSQIVWDFVRSNWEYLVERFTLNSRSLGRLIPRITQNFNSETRLDEMEAFFAKYPDAGAGAAGRAQALEKVKANIKWMDLYYTDIENWLETYVNSVTPS